MKNTVYTYDTFERYNYEVTDYTSIYYGNISEYLKQYSEYFMSYKLKDDEKLENVSYSFYQTTDYADLILAINQDVFLWNVPYNQDINIDRAEILAKSLLNASDLINMNTNEKDRIINMATISIDESNELKRHILIPKPDYISTIISLVENYKKQYYLNKVLTEEEARYLISERKW